MTDLCEGCEALKHQCALRGHYINYDLCACRKCIVKVTCCETDCDEYDKQFDMITEGPEND